MSPLRLRLATLTLLAASLLLAPWLSDADETPRCTPTTTRLNPSRHQLVYTVGVLAIRGNEAAFKEFNSTFADYLTATAGQRFDPPVRFQLKPLNFVQLFTDTEATLVDFIYVNPSAFSCIESEYGAQSLVSQISRRVVGGQSHDLTRFGGVIATLRNNTEINSIQDLKGKVIAAASISGLGSGQMQFKEMLDAGMSYVNDPKQLVFTSNQGKVVKGLLAGDFDVAFVRTDQLERSKDSNGNPIDTAAVFKIIDPKPNLEIDGMPFPFQSSTPLFPEWNLAALSHVADDVSSAVQEAMRALSQHAHTGKSLRQCQTNYNTSFCDTLPFPSEFDLEARCDTTKEVAMSAHTAMTHGKYAGWRTTLSYMQLRSMQQATGFISMDKQTNKWQCVKSKEIYQAISCPAGYFRKTKEEVSNGCASQGLECKEGFQCLCSPCVKGFDVDVKPITTNDWDTTQQEQRGTIGCEKMSLCGSTRQRQPLAFQAIDNLARENANMTVILHDGHHTRTIQADNTDPLNPHVYNFTVATNLEGVMTMELFINGEQIPASPLRVPVGSRDCEADYGDHFEADSSGECICQKGYTQFGSTCIQNLVLLPLLFGLAIWLVATISYFYLRHKRREADLVWTMSKEDLKYPDTPVILGQGTFGLVELASVHGTNVAVKRVLPPQSRKTGNKKMTMSDYSNEVDLEACDLASAQAFKSNRNRLSRKNSLDLSSQSAAPFGLISGYRIGSMSNTLLKGVQKTRSSAYKEKSYRQLKADFVKEMRLLSKLRHPCITTVMGAVVGKHEPLLVLEHCELGSLYDLLHNETVHIEGELLLPILRDIVQGVRFLHSLKPKIIHGDLKSKNILVTRGYRAKVADFGLSQKRKKSGAIGTPFFMSPELLRGESNSTASDVYALGIVFYEIYERKDPYHDDCSSSLLKEICDPIINKRPPVPARCPPEVSKLMKACWEGDPAARPSAEDLDERLKLFHVENVDLLRSQPRTSNAQHSSNTFLYQVFPKHIADALMRGERVEPEKHDSVTIFFSDVVNFTTISSMLSPLKVSSMLDRLYLAFDSLCKKYQIFKVETVGDAFMAVSNLIEDQSHDHVKRVAQFSLEAIQAASQIRVDLDDPDKGFVEIRVGFHTGPVVSNVIGSLNPRFGLFGDTVNVASRMESNSKPCRIHCSYDAAKLLKKQAPEISIEDRGTMHVKGKGKMKTFWVVGDDDWQTDDCSSSVDIPLFIEEGEESVTEPESATEHFRLGAPEQMPRYLQEIDV